MHVATFDKKNDEWGTHAHVFGIRHSSFMKINYIC